LLINAENVKLTALLIDIFRNGGTVAWLD